MHISMENSVDSPTTWQTWCCCFFVNLFNSEIFIQNSQILKKVWMLNLGADGGPVVVSLCLTLWFTLSLPVLRTWPSSASPVEQQVHTLTYLQYTQTICCSFQRVFILQVNPATLTCLLFSASSPANSTPMCAIGYILVFSRTCGDIALMVYSTLLCLLLLHICFGCEWVDFNVLTTVNTA